MPVNYSTEYSGRTAKREGARGDTVPVFSHAVWALRKGAAWECVEWVFGAERAERRAIWWRRQPGISTATVAEVKSRVTFSRSQRDVE